MTIGDLFDPLGEKLKTGEFSRLDVAYIVGTGGEDGDLCPITDVCKTSGDTVQIEFDGVTRDSVMGGGDW